MLSKFKNVVKSKVTQAVVLSLGFVGTASATTPADPAIAAISSLGEKAQSYLDAAWPVILIIFGGIVGIKLFKKIGSKAT